MSLSFEIVVAGGGPAGIAAAIVAAESGKRVAIVDDNPRLGGQIWRGGLTPSGETKEWHKRLEACASLITHLPGARIVDHPAPRTLVAEAADGVAFTIEYGKLILATGAREGFLPFPGWTLPNVMGAGALQAMVKSGLSVEGKRVVVAGTGPLLMAVAAYLRHAGAKVLMVCEQASLGRLARFGMTLARDRDKLLQTLRYGRETISIPFRTSCWPVAASGAEKLTGITLRQRRRQWQLACDYLACGFHLVPNTELASLLGCRLQDGFVAVDETQSTSVPDVYCAGEATGIGGVELSLLEGQIAGLAAAGRHDQSRTHFRARSRAQGFASTLAQTFALRSELRSVPTPETIVCRCEDVPLRDLLQHTSWRSAKLHTRCGMGPCQGRICGAATHFLFGWNQDSVRPPVFPARVSTLAHFAHKLRDNDFEAKETQ
ncbi:MAG: NAD(P)/FAD-dependent oxidoreductase [Acidobacteria bacterium]|nr:NAD(P)/FAD-dependent oxidoreductase [Acidobacteriota bacterium]